MREDPDVQRLDPTGRFVVCRTCESYRTVHGGRRPPRPVRMTSRFCTRAWELHKQRNRAHTRDRPRTIGLLTTERAYSPAVTDAVSLLLVDSDSENNCPDSRMIHEQLSRQSDSFSADTAAVAPAIEPFVEQHDGSRRYDSDRTNSSEQIVSDNEASCITSGDSSSGDESTRSERLPLLNLLHAIQELVHGIAWPHASLQREQLDDALGLLEELAANVREMQSDQTQFIHQFLRLQEQTNAVVEQLLEQEEEELLHSV